MFPVVENGHLEGCVTAREAKEIPREQRGSMKLGEIATACARENIVSPDADAVQALSIMSRNRVSRLMVTDGKWLVGIISLKDLLKFIADKAELEE